MKRFYSDTFEIENKKQKKIQIAPILLRLIPDPQVRFLCAVIHNPPILLGDVVSKPRFAEASNETICYTIYLEIIFILNFQRSILYDLLIRHLHKIASHKFII